MTPEQIGLVQSSFASLGPRLPALGAYFYRELFIRDPSRRALFSTDLAEQHARSWRNSPRSCRRYLASTSFFSAPGTLGSNTSVME
jgi:hypothetical protein